MEEKLSIEVLVATMNQNDHALIGRMNLQTDAVIGNQCGRDGFEEFTDNGHRYRYYNRSDRGVGLNRNTTLMRADADIIVFADDDMIFYDGYEKTVLDQFKKHPDADVLLFNIGETPRVRCVTESPYKINLMNYGRFGAARIVCRREAVSMRGISFNTNFGGGTKHSSGEDSLFLRDCLRAGLKMYAVPAEIARLDNTDRGSTWFKGFTENYFFDKGLFYRIAHPVLGKLFCMQYMLRHSDETKDIGKEKAKQNLKKGFGSI